MLAKLYRNSSAIKLVKRPSDISDPSPADESSTPSRSNSTTVNQSASCSCCVATTGALTQSAPTRLAALNHASPSTTNSLWFKRKFGGGAAAAASASSSFPVSRRSEGALLSRRRFSREEDDDNDSENRQCSPKRPQQLMPSLYFRWIVNWASECKQTLSKENQDGWFVVRGTAEKINACGCWEKRLLILPPESQQKTAPEANELYNELTTRILNISLEQQTVSPSRHGFVGLEDTAGEGGGDEQAICAEGSLWSYGVLDGHGSGGRQAALIGSKVLAEGFKEALKENSENSSRECISAESCSRRLLRIREVTQNSFIQAQQKILESNLSTNRDFGTTAIVSTCAGRYVVTANCGDSPALFLVGYEASPTCVYLANVRLSSDHSLQSKTELQRIASEGRGRVVVGDGGVPRLIPAYYSYDQAKVKGLSINMSRALGHFVLSQCSLSPQPQFTLLDLLDIYITLKDLPLVDAASSNDVTAIKTLLFEARDFDGTFAKKFHDLPTRIAKSDLRKKTDSDSKDDTVSQSATTTAGGRGPRRRTRRKAFTVFEPPAATTNWGARASSNDRQKQLDWLSPPESEKNNNKPELPPTASADKNLQNIIRKSISFLIMMTDGVSDVLQRQQVGEIVYELNKTGSSPAAISKHLIELAASIREKRGFRPDNCTCVVVRMDLSEFI